MECKCLSFEFARNQFYIEVEPYWNVNVIQRYVDGGAKKQFQFAFTSKEQYDEDARINIDNSEFFQKFEDWLEQQNFTENLPDLPDGKIPVRFETLSKGYLYDIDGNLAKYRIECRLLYSQEV